MITRGANSQASQDPAWKQLEIEILNDGAARIEMPLLLEG